MISEKKSPRALATPGHTTGRHGVGNGSRNIYLHPDPWEGSLGSLRASRRVKRKKQPSWTASSFERKTRLEPTMLVGNISRIYVYTPDP